MAVLKIKRGHLNPRVINGAPCTEFVYGYWTLGR